MCPLPDFSATTPAFLRRQPQLHGVNQTRALHHNARFFGDRSPWKPHGYKVPCVSPLFAALPVFKFGINSVTATAICPVTSITKIASEHVSMNVRYRASLSRSDAANRACPLTSRTAVIRTRDPPIVAAQERTATGNRVPSARSIRCSYGSRRPVHWASSTKPRCAAESPV